MNDLNCDKISPSAISCASAHSQAEYLATAGGGAISNRAQARAAIFVRLGGGASHMDTFDLKPDARAI